MSVRSTQDAGPTLDADVERMGGRGGAGGQWVVHASHQLRSKRTENHIQRKKPPLVEPTVVLNNKRFGA